jgi:hypothetical protein
MKQFIVENQRKKQTIKVILHNPPFEDDNVLEHVKWKSSDCTITEVHAEYNEDLKEPSFIDDDLSEDEGEE